MGKPRAIGRSASVEIIAHRGASHTAPENTLAAVNLAWEMGADAVEVDIQLSRDSRIVVIHDPTTRRTANNRRKVEGQNLAELKALDAGAWKHPRWGGERIPTLAEVLETIPPGKRLFVEVKCGPAFLKDFAATLKGTGRTAGEIVLIGFSWQTMRLAKERFPQIEMCLVADFQQSKRTGQTRPTAEDLIGLVRRAGLDGVDADASGPIDAAFVRKVKQAGLSFYVWTVDSVARARQLAKAGVDGITTNRPDLLRVKLS